MASPRGALDRLGDQAVDLELAAQVLQHFHLLDAGVEVGRHHVAGERISGLAQLPRQRVADELDDCVDPVLLTQYARRLFRGLD